MTDTDLFTIVSRFCIKGAPASITPFGSGHINDTYLVEHNDPASPDYLLQRINHAVFRNVEGLMRNFETVTRHIELKLRELGEDRIETKVLKLIRTHDNNTFTRDNDGNYWRLCLFIPGARSYDIVSTAQQAFEGGKAFGRFQVLLADLDPAQLIDTIPQFHHIQSRLTRFEDSVTADPFNRAASVAKEIDFIRSRADQMSKILKLGNEGKLPLRITHNDTKFNNVLLDANDEALCVIDLDTVMPGYIAYDFGDAVRTIINTAAEDEADLDKINLNVDLFSAYVKGYFEYAAVLLTPTEKESLFMGALLLPYMQGVRFLTDYLEGDHYFKIKSPHHNLQRTKAQFRLVERLEENAYNLNLIINNMAAPGGQNRSFTP